MTDFRKNYRDKISKIALITVVLFCTWAVKGYAQYRESYNTFVGGLVAGANFTQVDGDGYRGYHKIGINAGGIVYLPFGDVDLPIDGTIALSMEVLYVQKGSASNGPSQAYGLVSQNINLQYGEVPIQLNYFRGAQKSSVGAGLSIGYLGRYEELIDKGGGKIIKNGFPFRRYELSFVLTGNIHLYRGFSLSPRFQYALIPIRVQTGGYGRTQQFNNVLSLRLMYLIGKRQQRY
jgi:hypothetical protein